MKRDFKEEDLFPAVENYFENLGYTVRGEVKDCDIACIKDDVLIILELKKSLSLELLVQGVKRQKLADFTFLVIPRPKRFSINRKFQDTLYLLKRLSLGLIMVDDSLKNAEVILQPQEFEIQKSRNLNRTKLLKLKEELSRRVSKVNRGGQNRKKIVTTYREECLRILYSISKLGNLAPKNLVLLGIKKAPFMLRDNYYNWFIRVARGIYGLSEIGVEALKANEELIEVLKEDMDIRIERFNNNIK